MSKRRALAVAPLDLHILGDAKFQRLMRRLPRPEFREAFALYVELLIQAHSQDRRDVVADWCDDDDAAPLAHLRSVGLIDDVGIPQEPFDEWRHKDKLGFDSEAQAERGRKRMESAERDAAGRVLPVSDQPAGTSHDQPVRPASEPGTVRSGTVRSGAVDETPLALARDGLPSLTREAVDALSERTGRSWSQAGDKTLGEFDRLVGEHGLEKVLKVLDQVRDGRLLTAKQIVWPATRVLEPFADVRSDPKAVAVEERQVEIKSDFERRLERTQREAHSYGAHVNPAEFPRCPECVGEVAQ